MARNFFKCTLFTALLFGSVNADTIYVNVNSTSPFQNGTSWTTAFKNLQDALDQAALTPESDDIWVAQGVYFPTKIYSPNGIPGGASGLNTPNLATFDLPDNVTIFGGFKGTETKLDQRNPEKYLTVLSGATTSWHVVTLGNDINQTGVRAELNGLRIVQGNAQGPAGSAPFVQPFTFDHSSGGGVYTTFDSILKVKNVLFADNAAVVEGGAFFSNNSSVHIKESKFIDNTAGLEGGAVEILNTFETSPHKSKIKSSFFKGNSAGSFGGAIVTEGTVQNEDSFSQITDCTFKYNSSQIGGAVAIDSLKVDVKNCIFKKNFATVAGGALSSSNIVNTFVTAIVQAPFTPFTTTVAECLFDHNIAQGNQNAHDTLFGGPAISGVDFPFGGGAIAVYINGYLNAERSEFRDNVAQNSNGGAILNGFSSGENILGSGANGFIVQTNVADCKFMGNKSPTENGGAIASLPSTFEFSPPLPITVESTQLSAIGSHFRSNIAGLSGGAIYLNFSTARIKKNHYEHNKAFEGNSIFGIDSVINGDSTSPFIRNN